MMDNAIRYLKKQADRHRKALTSLEKQLILGEFEMQSDQDFLEGEIENQKKIILELTNAIEILRTREYK